MLVRAGQVRPELAAAEIAIMPVKPLTAVEVIVCIPEAPARTLTVREADGAMAKSTTWNVMTAVA